MDNRNGRSTEDLLDESLGLHVELRPGKHLRQSEEPPAVEEADYPHFRRLTFFSVLAGLCPLIPVPFVDDWALGLIQRRMVRDLGENRRLGLQESEVQILTEGNEKRWPGVVKGSALLVRRGARKVVGKLFKTAFYALLLRDGIHRAVETFVQGYLLLYAARIPNGLRPAGRTPERVRAVRAAVMSTLQEADVTPIHKAMGRSFRRSFDLLSKAAGLLGTVLGRFRSSGSGKGDAVPLQEEEELLGGFVDNLAATLWGDQEYFEGLERAFDERFARQQPRAIE